MTARQKSRPDLYAEITATLIAQIERDPGAPQMPWRRTATTPLWMPRNASTDAFYRGINVLMLWATAEERGFSVPVYATYKQWQEIGAQVRGGEKGARIVKYGEYETEPDEGDPLDDGRRLYLKGYTVFNAAQVDGYPMPEPPPSLGPVARIARVREVLSHLGAKVEIGGERAFYRPSTDTIHMPDEGLFTGTATMSREESWAATELHEHGHWTSHKSRCDRQLGKRFGDRQYCAEELVAEIFSAQMCAILGVTQDVRPDHAQYLGQWLELMKADSKAIFTAAAAASKAVDYVMACQPPGAFPEHDTAARLAEAKAEIAARADAANPPPTGDPQETLHGYAYVVPERPRAAPASRRRRAAPGAGQ